MACLGLLGAATCESPARPPHPPATAPTPAPLGVATSASVVPRWRVNLPRQADAPLLTHAGPSVHGDHIVVGVSGLGFAAVALADGKVRWHKPAGLRLATPLWHEHTWWLLDDCLPSARPADAWGCLRQVASDGQDVRHIALSHQPGAHVAAMPLPWQLQTDVAPEPGLRLGLGPTWFALRPASGQLDATPHDAPALPLSATYELARASDGALRIRRTGETTPLGPLRLAGACWPMRPSVALLQQTAAAGQAHVHAVPLAQALTTVTTPGATGLDLGAAVAVAASTAGPYCALAAATDTSLRHHRIVLVHEQQGIRWRHTLPTRFREQLPGLAITDAGVVVLDGAEVSLLSQ